MEYISPISKKKYNNSNQSSTLPQQPKKPRAVRSDKLHPIKFPVNEKTSRELKSYYQLIKRELVKEKREQLKQTDFNTHLLRFGLQHLELIDWDQDYQDTKKYMKTNLYEREYESFIGGPYGLSIQKDLSNRKVVTFIVYSILKYLKEAGSLEKIIESI